jgi:nitrous oxide reductase accessory protein NosL
MKTDSQKALRAVLALAALALLASAGAAGCDKIETLVHGDRCVLSDRAIHPYMAAEVAVEGGPSGRACCIRCAITYAQQTGKQVRVMSVTDYRTRKPIAPDHAFYVTGSNVAPCVGPPMEATAGRRECCILGFDRCAPSTLAFASEQDAIRFQREHGGRIETFAELERLTGGRLIAAKK